MGAFFRGSLGPKHFVTQFVVHPESKKGGNRYGTAESTVQKAKNYQLSRFAWRKQSD
jgi:hypothetical protein